MTKPKVSCEVAVWGFMIKTLQWSANARVPLELSEVSFDNATASGRIFRVEDEDDTWEVDYTYHMVGADAPVRRQVCVDRYGKIITQD